MHHYGVWGSSVCEGPRCYPKKDFLPSQRRFLPLGGAGGGLFVPVEHGFHKAIDFVKAVIAWRSSRIALVHRV